MVDVVPIVPGPFALIGDGLADRLKLAFPTNRFTHRWFPAKVTRPVWSSLLDRTPLVGIGFQGMHEIQTVAGLSGVSRWSIYLAVRNEAGDRPRLFGDAQGVGLLTMLGVAGAVLHGYTIPEIGTVQVTEIANGYIEDFDDARLAIGQVDVLVKADLAMARVLGGDLTVPGTLPADGIAWSIDATPALSNGPGAT